MIFPRPRSIMPWTTAWVQTNGPVRFVSRTASQSALLIWASGPRRFTPALLTSTSIGPTSFSMRATERAHLVGFGDIESLTVRLQAAGLECLDGMVQLGAVPAVEHDHRPRPSEATGDGQSQTATRSGNQSDGSIQIEEILGHGDSIKHSFGPRRRLYRYPDASASRAREGHQAAGFRLGEFTWTSGLAMRGIWACPATCVPVRGMRLGVGGATR